MVFSKQNTRSCCAMMCRHLLAVMLIMLRIVSVRRVIHVMFDGDCMDCVPGICEKGE